MNRLRRKPARASTSTATTRRASSGSADAAAAAVPKIRLVMAGATPRPWPWSDRGAARDIRRDGLGTGDFVERIVPCTGSGNDGHRQERSHGTSAPGGDGREDRGRRRGRPVLHQRRASRGGGCGRGGHADHRGGRRVRARGVRRERRVRGFEFLAEPRPGRGRRRTSMSRRRLGRGGDPVPFAVRHRGA